MCIIADANNVMLVILKRVLQHNFLTILHIFLWDGTVKTGYFIQNFWWHFSVMHTLQKYYKWTLFIQ